MSFRIVETSASGFEQAAGAFPGQSSFAQSAQMGAVRAALGWAVSYILFCEGEEARGAAMCALSASKAPCLDILCGPLLDMGSKELCVAWTAAVKEHAKRLKAASVHINPNITLSIRNPMGDELERKGGSVVENLRAAGWEWGGLSTNTPQPRFLYKLDLKGDYESMFASFATSVRTATRRARENRIRFRRIGADELPAFKAVLEETAERQGFEDRSLGYYQAMLAGFGEDAIFMLGELHLRELRESLAERLAALEARRQQTKAKGKLQQLDDEARGVEGLLAKAEGFPDKADVVAVNAGLFIRRPSELVYLFGGTRSAYMGLNAVYLLQEEMMRLCFAEGIGRYNFYGISGVFNPADPTYGVLAFKQAYRGYIDELIGDFSIVIDPMRYNAARVLGGIKRRLK